MTMPVFSGTYFASRARDRLPVPSIRCTPYSPTSSSPATVSSAARGGHSRVLASIIDASEQ